MKINLQNLGFSFYVQDELDLIKFLCISESKNFILQTLYLMKHFKYHKSLYSKRINRIIIDTNVLALQKYSELIDDSLWIRKSPEGI